MYTPTLTLKIQNLFDFNSCSRDGPKIFFENGCPAGGGRSVFIFLIKDHGFAIFFIGDFTSSRAAVFCDSFDPVAPKTIKMVDILPREMFNEIFGFFSMRESFTYANFSDPNVLLRLRTTQKSDFLNIKILSILRCVDSRSFPKDGMKKKLGTNCIE